MNVEMCEMCGPDTHAFYEDLNRIRISIVPWSFSDIVGGEVLRIAKRFNLSQKDL